MKLINYTSAKGDKLQGALYLPGELRAGQEVSDARHDLREALEPREQLRDAERNEHAEPQHLHEPRLRGVRSGHRVSRQRSGHVGGVVRDSGREGGDRDRHDRLGERRTVGPLVGRLPDGVPRHADEHLQVGDRRRAAHRHGEHVRLDLLEYRRRGPGDLRVEPGPLQGQLRRQLRRLHPQLAELPREEREDAADHSARTTRTARSTSIRASRTSTRCAR